MMNNCCLSCGKTLLAPFNYNPVNFNFRVHDNSKVGSLLNQKKLYLVLDLDHTLLNSTRLDKLDLDEEYLKTRTTQNSPNNDLFILDKLGVMTKLRPFVHKFLQEANKMFEMYIYTMGDRAYALEMAKLLDPENQYFQTRIISRDDCPNQDRKGLNVLQVPEKLGLVLDDTEAIWQSNKDNLIVMDRYFYFSSGFRELGYKNCKSLAQLKRDEDEFDGALATILRVLTRIHHDFFYINPQYVSVRDARQVLKTNKRQVLRDCKIVFSAVFPRNFVAANHRLWKIAEELGATCSTELDSSVTHVVSTDGGTEKSLWAVRGSKFLVNPKWIEAALFLWRRQLEDKFPVAKCPKRV
ncbi:RNA polymerase II C-terminal domain phosphatase-like 4 [Chenopodium quinoa]|nr:RNA polymerase II C-terminal domain phosphatase-like 4 [Chenopodium quinoa]